jgi:hypothetical protein
LRLPGTWDLFPAKAEIALNVINTKTVSSSIVRLTLIGELVGGVEENFDAPQSTSNCSAALIRISGSLSYNSIRPESLARCSSMPDGSGDFETDDVGRNPAGKRLI